MDELDLQDPSNIFSRFGDLEKLAKESLPQPVVAAPAKPNTASLGRSTLGTRPARIEVKSEEPPRPTTGRFSQKTYEPALRDPAVMRAICNLAVDTPEIDAPRFSPAQVPALDASPKATQKISGRNTRRSLPTVTILTSKPDDSDNG